MIMLQNTLLKRYTGYLVFYCWLMYNYPYCVCGGGGGLRGGGGRCMCWCWVFFLGGGGLCEAGVVEMEH